MNSWRQSRRCGRAPAARTEGLVLLSDAPLLGAMQWRPPRSPSRRGPGQTSAPSPDCSLAARLHVTKQNPPSLGLGSAPLCPRPDPPTPPPRKGPPPRCLRRVPPRGGGRRSPQAPQPPGAAASPNPGPGLLVQHQLRLLRRRRHLSLCGKMRPFGWLGPSLGRRSPARAPEAASPNFFRHPQARCRHSPEAQTHSGPGESDQITPETHSLVPCASNRGDVGSARRPRVTRRSVRYSAPRPPSAPRFSPPAPVPTAQARGFPASPELRAAGVASEEPSGSFEPAWGAGGGGACGAN